MSFMNILKAREIDPILYEEAKKLRVSEKEINETYDYFERDKLKEFISAKIKGIEGNINPLTYKFTDMNESKTMFPRIIREIVNNLNLGNVMDKKTLTQDDVDELDKIKDVLYRLALFGKDTKIGSKKVKPQRSETRKTEVSSLLESVFTIVAKNGFRVEDEDVQEFKKKFKKVDINKIISFFLDGKPVSQLHSVLLEDTSAKWDDSEEDWIIDGQIAYKEYSGKNSKELFNEIVEGLGIKALSRKEIFSSRGSLLEHFKLDFETLTEELMTILHKKAEEYTEEDEKLLFRSPVDKLESVLIDIANEADELQDKLEPHLRQPSQSELKEVEKYLDVIEFIIAILKLRGDYMASPNIEEPLIDIDEPRDIDLEREFPELESAGENFLGKSNVRKRLGE